MLQKIMLQKDFLKKYFQNLRSLITFNNDTIKKIINVSKIITEADKNGKKTIIFGNGGSSAIASHFSVDLTKNARVRCVNFNEPDMKNG